MGECWGERCSCGKCFDDFFFGLEVWAWGDFLGCHAGESVGFEVAAGKFDEFEDLGAVEGVLEGVVAIQMLEMGLFTCNWGVYWGTYVTTGSP